MKELKFFRCMTCGNLTAVLVESGVPMMCCGKPMTLLEANSTEAATEKHIPAVSVNGNVVEVQVGSVIHPMLEEHHIDFIAVEFADGSFAVKKLEHTEQPVAKFAFAGTQPVKVYEYCNLHGLWVANV